MLLTLCRSSKKPHQVNESFSLCNEQNMAFTFVLAVMKSQGVGDKSLLALCTVFLRAFTPPSAFCVQAVAYLLKLVLK